MRSSAYLKTTAPLRDSLGRSAIDMARGDDNLKGTDALQELEEAPQ
jgi:hypothetical protein